MKTENRSKIIKAIVIISIILLVLILAIIPLLSSGFYFIIQARYRQCKELSLKYQILNLNCLTPSLDYSNLIAVQKSYNQVSEKIKIFETEKNQEKLIINQDLTIIRNYLDQQKIDNTIVINASTYLETYKNKDEVLSKYSKDYEKIKEYHLQLDQYQEYLTPDENSQVKDLKKIPEFLQITKIPEYDILLKKIYERLLGNRNNKNSIPDMEYLELKKNLIAYSSDQFLTLGDQILDSPTTSWNNNLISVTTDKVIYDLAFARGYKWRKDANIANMTGTNELDLNTKAKENLNGILNAAKKDGHNLFLTSGYRSPSLQKIIFLSRLGESCNLDFGKNCSEEDIVSGRANPSINRVLRTTSVPGTSKHHTGYTVDINQVAGGALTNFKNTKGYTWLKADNFFNAKRFGFVPSYPSTNTKMGPDPEEWELIYVGLEKLKK